jgi:periplasmic divalent cation tolerance protein
VRRARAGARRRPRSRPSCSSSDAKLCRSAYGVASPASAAVRARSKGTLYFALHPHAIHLRGRWVGLSYDGARLAACGHNIAPIRSIYRWQGEIHDHTEARVALHTRASLLPNIIDTTNRRHPYEVPCVIALPITDGNPACLRWIRESTTAPVAS